MSLLNQTPILRIFDQQKAKEFYVEFLGFTIDWVHRFDDASPLYLQISKDNCVLHLSEHHGDSTPGSAVRIQSTDVHAYNKELLAKDYKYARPGVETMPWGNDEMRIQDPFGNRVVFFSDSKSSD